MTTVRKTKKVRGKRRTTVRNSVLLSGRLLEKLQGVAGARVSFVGGGKRVGTATTSATGAFSKSLALTKKTTFRATVVVPTREVGLRERRCRRAWCPTAASPRRSRATRSRPARCHGDTEKALGNARVVRGGLAPAPPYPSRRGDGAHRHVQLGRRGARQELVPAGTSGPRRRGFATTPSASTPSRSTRRSTACRRRRPPRAGPSERPRASSSTRRRRRR